MTKQVKWHDAKKELPPRTDDDQFTIDVLGWDSFYQYFITYYVIDDCALEENIADDRILKHGWGYWYSPEVEGLPEYWSYLPEAPKENDSCDN
jgi:hypothetical protein